MFRGYLGCFILLLMSPARLFLVAREGDRLKWREAFRNMTSKLLYFFFLIFSNNLSDYLFATSSERRKIILISLSIETFVIYMRKAMRRRESNRSKNSDEIEKDFSHFRQLYWREFSLSSTTATYATRFFFFCIITNEVGIIRNRRASNRNIHSSKRANQVLFFRKWKCKAARQSTARPRDCH